MLSMKMQAGNGWLAPGAGGRVLPICKTQALRELTPSRRSPVTRKHPQLRDKYHSMGRGGTGRQPAIQKKATVRRRSAIAWPK
jgi:hypothetical protein